MGVYESRGQLAKLMKELGDKWADTKMDWDDVVSQNFENRFLVPLEADLRNATAAMDHMALLLSQIKRDCSER
jgi:hypothetical protein